MNPPKALIITPVGTNDDGDLVLNVRLRRRSVYAARLLYGSARRHGVGRLNALRLTLGVVMVRENGHAITPLVLDQNDSKQAQA